MNILELEIEELIWEGIEGQEHEILEERGLPIYRDYTYIRQLDLGSYGRADIIGFSVNPSRATFGGKYRDIDVQIFELKKDKINANTFFQAIRYAKGIQHKAKHEGLNYHFNFVYNLVGKELEMGNDFLYVPDLIARVQLFTYKLSIQEGLTFKRHNGYSLIQPSFKKDSSDLLEIFKENLDTKQENQRIDMFLANQPQTNETDFSDF